MMLTTAISYCKYKSRIHLETYLSQTNLSFQEKIAISRLRLSNHSLMIEKGRHAKPRKLIGKRDIATFAKTNLKMKNIAIMPIIHFFTREVGTFLPIK